MKKIFLLLVSLFTINLVFGQQILTRTNTTPVTNMSWQAYRQNSPGNTYGTSFVTFEIRYDAIRASNDTFTIDLLDNRFGFPVKRKFLTADNSGNISQWTLDSILLNQTQIIGLPDSLSARYTKIQADARYLQSFTEIDPTYTASSWFSTTNNSSNWNTAYGWGNHATAGYLLASTAATTYQTILGYTPYNSTNPSGYISGITSSNVTTALGYTPYNSTNPAAYISSVPAQSFSSLTGKPTTLSGYGITDAYPLTGNPSAFLTSVPAQSWTSITGKPSFGLVATSNLYSDLTGLPTIPAAQVQSDYTASSGVTAILNKPILGTAAATNSTDYATSAQGTLASSALQPAGNGSALTALTSVQVGLGNCNNTSDVTKNSATATLTNKTIAAGSNTITGLTNSNLSGSASISDANISSATTWNAKFPTPVGTTSQYIRGDGTLNTFPTIPVADYVDSATTTTGVATFYLTSNHLSSGTALYTNVISINPQINNSTNVYGYSWAVSTDKKTLTLTANNSVPTGVITLLGISILGAPAAVSNGTKVYMLVKGN